MTRVEEEGGAGDEAQAGAKKKIWVTLKGLPLTIRLQWPFHPSTSGADFWVLHGDICLEGSGGLHAPVAVNLSQTVREVIETSNVQEMMADSLLSHPLALCPCLLASKLATAGS